MLKMRGHTAVFGNEAETLKFNRLGQINVRYPLGILKEIGSEYILRNVVQGL